MARRNLEGEKEEALSNEKTNSLSLHLSSVSSASKEKTRLSLCSVPPSLVPFRLPSQKSSLPALLHACTQQACAPSRAPLDADMEDQPLQACSLTRRSGLRRRRRPSRTVAAALLLGGGRWLWRPRRDAPSRGGGSSLQGGG